jgi:hypothetical protein
MAYKTVLLPDLKINRRSASTVEALKEPHESLSERKRPALHRKMQSTSTVDTDLKLNTLRSEYKYKSSAVKLSVLLTQVQLYNQLSSLSSFTSREHLSVSRVMTAVKALEGLVAESGWLSTQMWKLLSEIKLALFVDPSQLPINLRHCIYQEHEGQD